MHNGHDAVSDCAENALDLGSILVFKYESRSTEEAYTRYDGTHFGGGCVEWLVGVELMRGLDA